MLLKCVSTNPTPKEVRPYCQKCGWRKGGIDSWNGGACRCGHNEPPIRPVGDIAGDLLPGEPEKVVTDYWPKPIPTDKFDWSASFDNDEPDDDGRMLVGHGATESEAIADLLMEAEARYA